MAAWQLVHAYCHAVAGDCTWEIAVHVLICNAGVNCSQRRKIALEAIYKNWVAHLRCCHARCKARRACCIVWAMWSLQTAISIQGHQCILLRKAVLSSIEGWLKASLLMLMLWLLILPAALKHRASCIDICSILL